MGSSRREAPALREPVLGTSGDSPNAFAGEGEDMHDGLPESHAETWLRIEAAAAFDELRADPSQAVTGGQMRGDLAARHAERGEGQRRA